jgi:hypothetical protein
MIKKIFVYTTIVIILFAVSSCYYDKTQVQYPATTCDTTNVSYSIDIINILDASCQGCHKGSGSSSGINLYDYATIKSLALDGKYVYGSLVSSVSYQGGNPNPMPQGGNKLPECDINKLRAWANLGAPDN